MESRMRRKSHVRFGERGGENHAEQSPNGVPAPTLRDTTPSPDDVAVTRAIVQAGRLLDVDVLDHMVVGQGRWASLKGRDLGFV
jgi:hypothetical protein